MATTVKLSVAAANLGNPIYGNFGTYVVGSDGLITADSRDVAALLAAGAVFLAAETRFGVVTTPLIATVGKFVASVALANGALTIAAQPDVMRQGKVLVQAGTVAISAGSVVLGYIANDGSTTTDTLSLVTAASGTSTLFTSKGMALINTAFVTGLTGGASPTIQVDSTTTVAVPVNAGAKDITFLRETVDNTYTAVGSASTVTLGGIAPTVAPNNTHTYGWLYTANMPEV